MPKSFTSSTNWGIFTLSPKQIYQFQRDQKNKSMNTYLDINYQDRTEEIEELFEPTLNSIKRDPETYAQLVNDLLFHWMYGTRETELMVDAKQKTKIHYFFQHQTKTNV